MMRIPEELLEQIERGNALLFIGDRVVCDAEGRAMVDRLAAQLAARCGVDAAEEYTFPEAAQAYEDEMGRQALVQFVRDRCETLGDEPRRIHRLIAGLTDFSVLATTGIECLLERAFEEARRPLDIIIGNVDVAFEDERKAQLYKLRGSVEQTGSLVLTEDDHETFFDNQASISVVLQGYLARKTILFVGYDLADPHFKRLYRKMTTPLDKFARRAYAFGGALPPKVTRWCMRHGINVIETDITAFLEALTEQLETRARPVPIAPRPPAEQPIAPLPERPYKFLDYYEAKDAAIFFGRRRETQTLSSLIHAHRLVLLYGASGTGKTSLLLAGAVPRLERAEPPYEVLYVRALEDPARVIRRVVRRRLPEAPLAEGGSLVDFLNAATKALDRTLVIVLDQFEEFFIRFSPQFRAAFIAELGALYDARDVPIKVVLSLREDWLASVGEIERRIPEVFRTRMRLLPLSRDQAREAITGPAERLRVRYEPALIKQLLDDLLGELMGSESATVMPPQLQLVCSALYDGLGPDEHVITMSAYEQLGGAQGVLQQYLEDELARLGADERALARGVLAELVTSRGTKAVRTDDELVLALGVDASDVEPLLEKLVRSRLLRALEREDGGTAYELAHEYLVDEIRSWIGEEERELKRARELLTQELDNARRFGTHMDRERLDLIEKHRDRLRLAPDAQALLLRSAVEEDHRIDDWLEATTSPEITFVALTSALSDGGEGARARAAQALATVAYEDASEPLFQATLTDPSAAVREAAAKGLVQVRGPAAVAELSRLVEGEQEEQQAPAAEALAHILDADDYAISLGWPAMMRVTRQFWAIRFKERRRQAAYKIVGGALGGLVGGMLFIGILSYPYGLVEALLGSIVFGVPLGLLLGSLIVAGLSLQMFFSRKAGLAAGAVGAAIGGALGTLIWYSFASLGTGSGSASASLMVFAVAFGGVWPLGLAATQRVTTSRGYPARVAGAGMVGVAGGLVGAALVEGLVRLQVLPQGFDAEPIAVAAGFILLGTAISLGWAISGFFSPSRSGTQRRWV